MHENKLVLYEKIKNMKQKRDYFKGLAFIMLLIVMPGMSSLAQENLIVNPHFEDWTDGLPDGWHFVDLAEMETDNVLEGTHSLRQRVLITRLWQQLEGIVEGAEYVISYWYFDDDPDAKSRIWAYWTSGDDLLEDDAAILRPESYSEDASEWQEFNVTLVAPPGADGFRFEVRTYDEGSGGGSVYYDSFLFHKVPIGGHETFDNLWITGASYTDGTFLGQDGSDWTFVQCRGDREIDGKAIMIGRNTTPQSHFYSGLLEGGISTMTFDYKQAFTTNVNLQVLVNDELVATVTSDGQQGEILNSGVIPVHVDGDVTLKFINVANSSGQVVVDNIIWRFYDESLVPVGPEIVSVSQAPEDDISPLAEVSVSAEVVETEGSIDYVELRWGTEQGSYLSTIDMINIEGDIFSTESPIPPQPYGTNIYYIVYAEDVHGTSSSSDEMHYEVSIPLVEVISLADLRIQDVETDAVYLLEEEVFLTWHIESENQYYIQDETAAVILLDQDGVMESVYELYDGITGIAGRLLFDDHTLFWIPVIDPGEASSSLNQVVAEPLTISELEAGLSDYQARLVKLVDVVFVDSEGSFSFGEQYLLDDGNDEFLFAAIFSEADYIDEPIPDAILRLTGLVGMGDDGGFITARTKYDMQDISSPTGYSVVFTVIDDTETLDQILFAGDMTNWNLEEMLENPSYNWSVTLNLEPGSYAWNAMGDNGEAPPYWLIPGSHLNVTVKEDGTTTGDISFIYMVAGTSPLELSVVKMYPNPTGTYLSIESADGITDIKVYDISGQELYHNTPGNVFFYELNVGQFVPGAYIISVYTEDGRSLEKIQVTY